MRMISLREMMKKIIVGMMVIVLFGCNETTEQNREAALSVHFSKSTFIELGDSREASYAEMEFHDTTLSIRSEKEGWQGPFKYEEKQNLIILNGVQFDIVPQTNGSVILKSENEEFLLYNIPVDEHKVAKDGLDPFYLRRCYYLVHLGVITMDEAISYLNDARVSPDSMPEEEMIITN